MNNIKRIGLIASMTALSLALVACGGNEAANNGGENAANNTEANAGNNVATEEAADPSELGAIAVVSREDGSGTRGAFVEIVGILEEDENGEEIDMTTQEADIQNSTNGVMTTVAGNPSAIGYISLGSLNDTVKALSIDGVEPTAETIIAGDYAIARPFLLVTKGAPAEGSIEEDFLKFAHSKEGQDLAEQEGYVRVAGEEEYEAAGLSGSITVAGSTSVTPLVEVLVEAYTAHNPDVTIEIQSTGSSAGIQAATEGTAQIGMSSRNLKDEEKGELEELVLAQDGIAVIVNTENPLADMSLENVKNIFLGEMADWSELAE
ncbi:MAG: substrate-binding domain-containing protein [Tissierellia bacterium]|nr:substrate-binding domain-containing protein [Tissierellia bacterium]